ncbi:MAG: cysteine hydrolase family protein, partial [Candidatus Binatia bacterium]
MSDGFLKSLTDKIAPAHTALLVVDVQNDFCHDEGYVAKQGLSVAPAQAIVANLTRLIAAARETNVPVIFVQAIYDDKYLAGPFLEHFSKARVALARC